MAGFFEYGEHGTVGTGAHDIDGEINNELDGEGQEVKSRQFANNPNQNVACAPPAHVDCATTNMWSTMPSHALQMSRAA